MHRQVAVIRFAAEPTDPSVWQRRMEASRVSAEQKVRAFSHLGFGVDHQVLPGHTSAADFAALIDAHSNDPATSAIIVQYPPPPHLTALVQRMAPAKDIDGLLGDRSPQLACATADGISRVVRPYAQDNPRIAVVGGQGFVGSGVVRLLQQDGLRVESLDAGDDLRRVRQADIVVSATGQPHILTDEHIRPHHRLVVDSGFMPQPDGSIAGDIAPSAQQIPQHITPVPGGIGPTEMAVLMDRVVRQEADPGLRPWTVEAAPYRNRAELAALGNLPAAARAIQPGQATAQPAVEADTRRATGARAQGLAGSGSRHPGETGPGHGNLSR
ncbi:bifunctional 5,10-methylenetetrahydrofolate dehydrogenase/5,10-methenyltetrahydrofolate cyclohydrolase [Kribbella antibiotica]|uniref:Bifunctional 5,10-methylenetetrahydrofolate dehydrogenase/5,10-methenyltetrahydrofolate cyclohydrolase n=2 Tax=Kribbella antibiotica TaxID=190195 RepID=A0A4R4YMY6_9ACTN|nr:bifunctional 5,10-methylenetetrahydrofolate dehydrogenase/5,10-methenyltetrahydrofolate cyclohydrolase [Kribbella antibiotica]